MLRVVLDTNIIISALNFGGTPAMVMNLAVSGEIQNITSQTILDEVEGVLVRKFLWENAPARNVCSWLIFFSELVSPKERISVIDYQPDNRILECAVEGRAKLIISGDKKHLLKLKEYQGILILSPNQFLKLLPV